MSQKLRIGLIFGGRSGEHEVSIASALSVHNALDKAKYDVTLLAIDKQGRWFLPDTRALTGSGADPMSAKLTRAAGPYALVPTADPQHQLIPLDRDSGAAPAPFDVVIPILHGTYGEDGTIQGLLEMAQIPYVGSGVLGSALGMDKDASARILATTGIQTVPYLAVRAHDWSVNAQALGARIDAEIGYPCFVKPANAGSSVGVSKVKSPGELPAALTEAFGYDHKVLVQKGIDARELEVSVLGNEQPRASVVGEIIPRHEFYSYEAKYLDENGAELCIPARDLDAKVAAKVRDWAVLAFQSLECHGLARVDFFLDRRTGELYFNEINTIPGFTRISMYPKLWEASGLSYPALIDELIRLAMDRFAKRRRLKTERGP